MRSVVLKDASGPSRVAPDVAVLEAERRAPQTSEAPRLHLAFLDGIRGLTAFYVVLFHVLGEGRVELSLTNPFWGLFSLGHEAVVVFIVLSGVVLTLPVCRSPELKLPGDLTGFIGRRARRILPAYYASLFVLPLFFVAIELLKPLSGEASDWGQLADRYLNADMLSHIFLVHNVSSAWIGSFNPVLWSLTTEWWIYFVFALLLLPVWRRLGLVQALVLCVVLSLVPAALLALRMPTLWGAPHLLGAFGVGMGTAVLMSSPERRQQILRNRAAVGGLVIALALLFWLVAVAAPDVRGRPHTIWITDFIVAGICATFILLMASVAMSSSGRVGLSGALSRLLESRPLAVLGSFSYSLYLTHLVVWAMIGITLGLTPARRIVDLSLDSTPARMLVVIPVLLLGAYVFYLIFEKPFLRSGSRRPAA
jgi:peptidoglycan/LPS O-acetylase OafA/YrhL